MLVVAGANDPRCPIRQIENYLSELEKRDKEHEVYRFDAGHGSLVIEETIRQVEVALYFALRHVKPETQPQVIPIAGAGGLPIGTTQRLGSGGDGSWPRCHAERDEAISSAICTALRAAPLRRLSLLTKSARPRPPSTPGSWRMRPT